MSSSYPQPPKSRPWVLLVGAGMLLVALVLIIIGAFMAIGPVQDLADQPEQTAPYAVQLEQGEEAAVWSQTPGTSCTVDGPSGAVSDTSTGDATMTWGDRTLERVMSFEAAEAGEHTVSCTAPFVVGADSPTGGILVASLGSGLCCFSVVVLVVGLVVWMVRRGRA